ncbi:MAG: hypothetical protein JJE51_08765 [Thermoanaerobaculia bacterium]|nr:hypothetical protein [Thermoanaerobaculia bacterium]
MLKESATARVAVLCSKRAPGLDELLSHPQRGKLFEISCVITTESHLIGQERIEAAGVPVMTHSIRHFFEERGARLSDRKVRADYDAVTAAALRVIGVDTVLLLGYLYVLTSPMLDMFPDRILNIHDSDLTLIRPDGSRRYTGLHSTRDAILAGETETRSAVHFVTSTLDGGPVLMLSDAYPIAPFATEAALSASIDIVRAYSYAHREWMMRNEWGSLAARSLEYLAAGIVSVERKDDRELVSV